MLRDRGVADPRAHILAYSGPPNGQGATAVTLLVSPQPFTDEALARLTAAAERLRFKPVLTPDEAVDERFVALASPDRAVAAAVDVDADISPPTDDRPFFFQMADLGTIVSGAGFSRDDSTRPVLVLSLLAVIIFTLAIGFIVVPLLVKTDATAHRGMAPFYVYFAGIGLGFLLIEIAQLQRLSIFLGHPTYALVGRAVLAARVERHRQPRERTRADPRPSAPLAGSARSARGGDRIDRSAALLA